MARLTNRKPVRNTQAARVRKLEHSFASEKQFNAKLAEAFKDEGLRESVRKQYFLEAATGTSDDDRDMSAFRRLSSSSRDVSPLKFDKAMKLSFYQWQRNPLAQTLIRIPLDFCVGDDLAVKLKIKKRVKGGDDLDTDKTDAQQLWDDFWEYPVNNLENDFRNFMQDLLINGELVVPAAANEIDGRVSLGYMDPQNIKKAVTDPENIRQVVTLEMTPPDSAEKTIKRNVIRVDLDSKNKTFEKRIGDTFYWRINYVTNQTRGNGELVPLLDWLDALDQFLFDALEGFRLRNAFFYQLEMQGLSQKQLEEWQKKIRTPKTGTTRVVNDKAKWTVITPDLKAVDINTALKTFLTFIVGVGKTMPVHWFGSGDDANLASAKVMTVPTMRMLRSIQKIARRILKDMAYFVVDKAVLAGSLTLEKGEYVECEVSMFDFEKADSSVVASAFVQIVNALVVATDKKWVSPETARKIIHGFVNRLGVEIDADAEAKLAGQDPDEDGAADIIEKAKKKEKEKNKGLEAQPE